MVESFTLSRLSSRDTFLSSHRFILGLHPSSKAALFPLTMAARWQRLLPRRRQLDTGWHQLLLELSRFCCCANISYGDGRAAATLTRRLFIPAFMETIPPLQRRHCSKCFWSSPVIAVINICDSLPPPAQGAMGCGDVRSEAVKYLTCISSVCQPEPPGWLCFDWLMNLTEFIAVSLHGAAGCKDTSEEWCWICHLTPWSVCCKQSDEPLFIALKIIKIHL